MQRSQAVPRPAGHTWGLVSILRKMLRFYNRLESARKPCFYLLSMLQNVYVLSEIKDAIFKPTWESPWSSHGFHRPGN